MAPTKQDYERAREALVQHGEAGCVFEIGGSAFLKAALDQAIEAKEPVDVKALRDDLRWLDFKNPNIMPWRFIDLIIDHLASRNLIRTAPTPAERNSDTDPNLIWHGSKTYNPKHHEVAPAGSTRILAALRAMLEPLVEARVDARKGHWDWHWRKDDEHAPGSVASDNGYAVLMCPRYGKPDFPKDADFVALAANTLFDPEFINLVQGDAP